MNLQIAYMNISQNCSLKNRYKTSEGHIRGNNRKKIVYASLRLNSSMKNDFGHALSAWR